MCLKVACKPFSGVETLLNSATTISSSQVRFHIDADGLNLGFHARSSLDPVHVDRYLYFLIIHLNFIVSAYSLLFFLKRAVGDEMRLKEI